MKRDGPGLGLFHTQDRAVSPTYQLSFFVLKNAEMAHFFVGSLEFFLTKLFPSMVAAARERPLGNHVDQNLTKRFFNGACIFSHLFFAVTVACIAGAERQRERWKMEEGIGERRKETPLLVPFAFLSKSKTSNNYMDNLQS